MAVGARVIKAEQLYTVEQFEQMPEFSENFELIEGRIVPKVASFIHNKIALNILFAYHDFDRQKAIGDVGGGDLNVKIRDDYAPAPDVSFWKAINRPPRTKGVAPRPDLAVEIWSDSDLNTKKKREEARDKIAEYLKAGVELAWAINPDNQTVEVHRLGQPTPEVLDITGELSGEGVIPGFTLAVSKLFE